MPWLDRGAVRLLTRTGLDKYRRSPRPRRRCRPRRPISTANCAASAPTASPPSARSRQRRMRQRGRAGVLSVRPSLSRRRGCCSYAAIGRSRACSSNRRNSGCGARHMVRYVSRKGIHSIRHAGPRVRASRGPRTGSGRRPFQP